MDDLLDLGVTTTMADVIGIGESFGESSSSLAPLLSTARPDSNMTTTCSENLPHLNLTEFEYPYRVETWITITGKEVFKIIAYLVIFLVSLTGNLLVIMVVYYNAHMRSSTNQYLVNLAAADLLVTLVCMWVHLVRNFTLPNYALPALFCKLDSFIQTTSLLASVLTLTVISVGRFVAVMFPLHARTSPDRAQRVILLVWLTSAILASPTMIYRTYYSLKWKNHTTYHCDEFWPQESIFDREKSRCVTVYDAKRYYYTAITIALYFLPVVIMIVNYSLVVLRLWISQMPGEHLAPARNTATKKVVKMVSVVLIVFVICWTPLQSIILYFNFVHEDNVELPDWFAYMEFAAYFIAYSNSALNPIIYCGFNTNFRQGMMALLTCRQVTSGRNSYPRSTLRSTINSEKSEPSGTWRATTAGTRETTAGSTGPEPAILLEFNSTKRSKYGHRSTESPPTSHKNHDGMRDSGSETARKVPVHPVHSHPSSEMRETPIINNTHHHNGQRSPNKSADSRKGFSLLTFSKRGRDPSGSGIASRTPVQGLGPKSLAGCCNIKRKSKGKMVVVAVTEVRDNVSCDTREDML